MRVITFEYIVQITNLMPIFESTSERASDLGIELTPRIRGLLSEYDEASQKRWITNPWAERILNDIKWQIINNMRGGSYVPCTSSTTTTTTTTTVTITTTTTTSKSEPIVNDDSDSDEIDMFDIFA